MRAVTLLLTATFFAAPPPAVSSRSPQVPGVDYVQIDGSKTPNSIPQWLAWQNALSILARFAGDLDSVVFRVVAGNDDDRKLIGEFAVTQEQLWAACRAKQIALLKRFHGVAPDQVQGRLHQEQIACRSALLAATGKFVGSLSAQAAGRLRAFVDDHRSGIEILVPRAEIEQFYRPR